MSSNGVIKETVNYITFTTRIHKCILPQRVRLTIDIPRLPTKSVEYTDQLPRVPKSVKYTNQLKHVPNF